VERGSVSPKSGGERGGLAESLDWKEVSTFGVVGV